MTDDNCIVDYDEELLITGAARFFDLLYMCIRYKDMDSNDEAHSFFVSYDQGEGFHLGDTDWDTVAMAVVKQPQEKMVAISPEGEVFTYVGEIITEEKIKSLKGRIRNLAVIDGYAFACGMKRQVFKRTGEGSWVPMHAPLPKKSEGSVIGFEAIGGFSESEIYAVGWEGEIWRYDGAKWTRIDSPTNQILTAVTCGGDGIVFICGKEGILLKGRNDSWSVIGNPGFKRDLWDLHWFNGRLYAVTMTDVFELIDDELHLVNMGDEMPTTCYRLTSSEGVMWSLGTRDLFSFDGKQWKRIA